MVLIIWKIIYINKLYYYHIIIILFYVSILFAARALYNSFRIYYFRTILAFMLLRYLQRQLFTL